MVISMTKKEFFKNSILNIPKPLQKVPKKKKKKMS